MCTKISLAPVPIPNFIPDFLNFCLQHDPFTEHLFIPVLFSVSCSHWKFKTGKNWTEEVSNIEVEYNGFVFGVLTHVLSMHRTLQPYGTCYQLQLTGQKSDDG